MSKQVIVYSAPGCVECNYVKQMLEEEKISFEVRDVMSSVEYQQEVEKFGFMGVPVTVVGDKAIKGFNPELKELIETIEK
ncbi:glutaredoxin family protein [Bacillus sp. DTU_2020_1000418_1_SI_GHA_SEK_038]|uniref:glutaredoxin family protein n=1 Tax=Bacillus sp. DTU_2020_1000418_1_SI_GHA_SEK_038 TaxID=3077585 RepID=UPI0028EE6B88|nr:glutaredoxin family protein [Bacillus sp. DTU_2020_1000418_1_SI_GHA_SEK_038]WNS75703.1 glutaredoxin family protein [Bacillus sp. DTU_2020_1000418_1_SI_GHA_SEK_038]